MGISGVVLLAAGLFSTQILYRDSGLPLPVSNKEVGQVDRPALRGMECTTFLYGVCSWRDTLHAS
jgi:hypothetical protein